MKIPKFIPKGVQLTVSWGQRPGLAPVPPAHARLPKADTLGRLCAHECKNLESWTRIQSQLRATPSHLPSLNLQPATPVFPVAQVGGVGYLLTRAPSRRAAAAGLPAPGGSAPSEALQDPPRGLARPLPSGAPVPEGTDALQPRFPPIPREDGAGP